MNRDRKISSQTTLLSMQSDLLNLSNEAIFAWDFNGTIIYWNKGAEKMYGYSRKEAVGCISNVLLKTVQHPMYIDDIKLVLARDRAWDGEVIHTCKDGKKLILDTRQQVITNELGQRTVLEINRDITELKETENNLTELKNQLALEAVATKLLHKISTSKVHKDNEYEVLNEIIKTVVITTNADMGNIQFFDSQSGSLKIVANYGFGQQFIDYFNSVSKCQAACGRALDRRERVIVEDVTTSPIFVGTPDLPVMISAKALAVQSIPLLILQAICWVYFQHTIESHIDQMSENLCYWTCLPD